MDVRIRFTVVISLGASICYLSGTCHAQAYTPTQTEALHSHLFSSYSKKFRPNDTTNIILEFGLMHITELDIVTQKLHCVGFLIAYWIDDRLQWTPTDHGNMSEFFTLLSDVWSPPLLLNNAADEMKMLNDDSDLSSMRVHVAFNGTVIWLAPASFLAQCTINIQYYPFDSQECKLLVSSWLFFENQLNLSSVKSSINLDIFEEHGEWGVTKTTGQNVTRLLMGYSLPAVQFTVFLTRKYSYYLMNMILPVIVLAIMAPFVFILPVESGEKIGYALTILLSLSVVMTIVSDNIPPTSTHVCVLNVYLLSTFIICSVQTIVTVITCRLHELHNRSYKMGHKLQKLTGCLAMLVRYRLRSGAAQDVKRFVDDEKSSQRNEIKTKDSTAISDDKGAPRSVWTSNPDVDTHAKQEHNIEYNYDDLVCMYEQFNFVLFTIITLLMTLIFMAVLETGDNK